MKKMLFYMLFLTLFVFSSCQTENTPVSTPLDCGDNEVLVDGNCQIVKTDFEKTFDSSKEMTNYTLSVSIQQLADLYVMTLEVDKNKSSFEVDGKKEFYVSDSNTCEHYFPVDDQYRKETIDCTSSNDSFHFFKDMEASWFLEVSAKYFLKTEYNDEVAEFFQESFPGSTVSNLELIVGNTYFESIIFDVTVDETMYRFTMTLSKIGETSITLPSL